MVASRRGPKAPAGTLGGRDARVGFLQAGQQAVEAVLDDLGQFGDLVGVRGRVGTRQVGAAGAGRRDAVDDAGQTVGRDYRTGRPLVAGLATTVAV